MRKVKGTEFELSYLDKTFKIRSIEILFECLTHCEILCQDIRLIYV